jgi:hypothetical protein
MAVMNMRMMPAMRAFCCRSRLRLNRGTRLRVERRRVVFRLVDVLRERDGVFFLLVDFFRAIAQMVWLDDYSMEESHMQPRQLVTGKGAIA